MRPLSRFFMVAILLGSLYSCKNLACVKTTGTLKLTNTSISTVQKMLIDGINYGSLDPGESKEIDLPVGTHSFSFEGISGGSGCSAGSVIIQACKTAAYSCAH